MGLVVLYVPHNYLLKVGTRRFDIIMQLLIVQDRFPFTLNLLLDLRTSAFQVNQNLAIPIELSFRKGQEADFSEGPRTVPNILLGQEANLPQHASWLINDIYFNLLAIRVDVDFDLSLDQDENMVAEGVYLDNPLVLRVKLLEHTVGKFFQGVILNFLQVYNVL